MTPNKLPESPAFTPGSWEAHGTQIVKFGKDGRNICEISGPPTTTYVKHEKPGFKLDLEMIGNAHLIASAPEMYEALKAALPNLEWANIHGSRCEELLTQVRAALAKARGEK